MIARSVRWTAAALAVALWAGPAVAQEAQEPPAQEPPAQEPQEPAPAPQPDAFAVQLRGGFGGYTGSWAPLTSPGMVWGVSVGIRTARWAGLELGYEGSETGLQGRPGVLVRNGGQVLGKLFSGRDSVFPYVGAGVGLSYVDPSANADPFAQGDTVVEVPLVLGFDWTRGPLSLGARAGFTLLVGARFLEPLAPEGRGGFASGSLLLGFGF